MTPALGTVFHIKGRFCRSVNIAADYADADALTDYIVTPLTRDVLRLVRQGLRPDGRTRAWSITGPYGAGKSACAVFVGRLLGSPRDEAAWQLLRASAPALCEELEQDIPALKRSGLAVIPVVGSREPLAQGLFRSLIHALRSTEADAERGSEIAWLEGHLRAMRHGEDVTPALVSEAVERTTKALRAGPNQPMGVLLIVDELGKFLEYAAQNSSQGDIYLLQVLAELASRSGVSPLGLLVILHQSFERYAAHLSHSQREEWTKVQGRFRDIPFLSSTGEMLRLTGAAIETRGPLRGLAGAIAQEAARAEELKLTPRELHRQEARKLLQRCAPLHPTVALVLGRLFRSHLAQNERSLFAFLASGEPYSLQEYLRREKWDANRQPFYRLDQLYDYAQAALGSVLYSQAQGKRWAEIEDALTRLPHDCTPLQARLVKAIGLLGLLGDQVHLKASTEVLAYALACDEITGAADVQQALVKLVEWKIAIYRAHRDAYGLWEGSDVDLEDCLQLALAQVDKAASLAALLRQRNGLRPYLAKRHLHQTGTIRFFALQVTAPEELDDLLRQGWAPADGTIIFVLGNNGLSPEEIAEQVRPISTHLTSPQRELTFFAIPKDVAGLREALQEVMAWEWVGENTPALEGDRIARKELAGRLLDAQTRLSIVSDRCFDRAAASESALWVWAGERRQYASAAELSGALSDACDLAYHAAPHVHNELINRHVLSSAAAAARRTLIEHMLAAPQVKRLGIEGYPPQASMYLSVLRESGLHYRDGEVWGFGPGQQDDPTHVGPMWQAIDQFLANTEQGKRSVADLFALLQAPPYGIREGLLPVYLAAALQHWEAEVALYENGSFIPRADIASFERLIKSPQQFAVQRSLMGAGRAFVFAKFSALLNGNNGGKETAAPTLLTAVRPIMAFARQMPPYTRGTATLGPAASAVREAILSAREPQKLLFVDLPRALGLQELDAEADTLAAQAFFVELRKALLEMQWAYDRLLDAIEAQLGAALGLPPEAEAARHEAEQRALALRERLTDLRLKAFALRLGDSRLARREWLESIAACLVSKAPKQWSDQDALRYSVEVSDVGGQFRRVEEIAHRAGQEPATAARSLRLGVTVGAGQEWQDVVYVRPEDDAQVSDLTRVLDNVLAQLGGDERVRIAAVAELTKRLLSGRTTKPTKE